VSEPEIIEPEWEAHPVEVHGLSCIIGRVPSGWIICHDKSPRFCFGADSRDAAVAKANRGMEFWAKSEKPTRSGHREE